MIRWDNPVEVSEHNAPWSGVSPVNAVLDLATFLQCYVGAGRTAGECEAALRRLCGEPGAPRFRTIQSPDNQMRQHMHAVLQALLGDRAGVPVFVLENVFQAIMPDGVAPPYCVTVNGGTRRSWFVPPPGGGEGAWTSCVLYDRALEDKVVAQRALSSGLSPGGSVETPEAIMEGVVSLVRLLLLRGRLTTESNRRLEDADRERVVEYWFERITALARQMDEPLVAHQVLQAGGCRRGWWPGDASVLG